MNWQPINDQLKAVYSVDVDPYGRFVAAGRGGKVTVYDLATNGTTAKLDDPAYSSGWLTGCCTSRLCSCHCHSPLRGSHRHQRVQEVKLWQRQTTGLASVATLPQEPRSGAPLVTDSR